MENPFVINWYAMVVSSPNRKGSPCFPQLGNNSSICVAAPSSMVLSKCTNVCCGNDQVGTSLCRLSCGYLETKRWTVAGKTLEVYNIETIRMSKVELDLVILGTILLDAVLYPYVMTTIPEGNSSKFQLKPSILRCANGGKNDLKNPTNICQRIPSWTLWHPHGQVCQLRDGSHDAPLKDFTSTAILRKWSPPWECQRDGRKSRRGTRPMQTSSPLAACRS
eukprot:3822980-Amphidinium_carterae.1